MPLEPPGPPHHPEALKELYAMFDRPQKATPSTTSPPAAAGGNDEDYRGPFLNLGKFQETMT
eukprot:4544426-Pyramimonas_sp.AAC.1